MGSEILEGALRASIAKYIQNYTADDDPHAAFDNLWLDSFQATQLSRDLARQFHVSISLDTLLLSSLDHVSQVVRLASEGSTNTPLLGE